MSTSKQKGQYHKLVHKINQRGIVNWLAMGLFVVIVAAIGTRILTDSRAESLNSAKKNSGPSMAFIGDNQELYTASASGKAKPFKGKIMVKPDGNGSMPVTYASSSANLYYSDGTSGAGGLYLNIVDANGSKNKKLPVVLQSDYSYTSLAWSESYQKLAYVQTDYQTGQAILSTVNPDGSDPLQLYSGMGVGAPVWSPDGTKIAFPGETSTGANTVIVISNTGTNQEVLSPTCQYTGSTYELSWTPTSTNIVCGGGPGIYQVSDTNTNPVNLLATALPTGYVIESSLLSPDGTKVLYTTYNTAAKAVQNCSVYLLTLSTETSQTVDTINRTNCGDIAWSPTSTSIAFAVGSASKSSKTATLPTDVWTATSTGTSLKKIYTSKSRGYIAGLEWSTQ